MNFTITFRGGSLLCFLSLVNIFWICNFYIFLSFNSFELRISSTIAFSTEIGFHYTSWNAHVRNRAYNRTCIWTHAYAPTHTCTHAMTSTYMRLCKRKNQLQTYVYGCLFMRTRALERAHTCTYSPTQTRVVTDAHASRACTQNRKRTHMHTTKFTLTRLRIHTHARTHTYMHMYIRTYINTTWNIYSIACISLVLPYI